MDFIGSIWRGEATLAKVYWFYGAIGGVIFFFVPMTFFAAVNLLATANPVALAFAAIYGLGFAPTYMVIISVGIWRSANAYEGRALWGLLAKVSVVLGIIEAVQEISRVIF